MSVRLPRVAVALLALPALAQTPRLTGPHLEALRAQEPDRAQQAVNHINGLRAALGLTPLHDFRIERAHTDDLGQTHVRLQQRFQGVPIFGGEIVAHLDPEGHPLAPTLAHFAFGTLNTTPGLPAEEALAVVHALVGPSGPYAEAPRAELVIAPRTESLPPVRARRFLDDDAGPVLREALVSWPLAYHVHVELENGRAETRHEDFLIHAHTGAVLERWSTLHTAGATGTGQSQWYGTVNLATNSTGSGYELRDTTRGTGGTFGNNVTTNLNNGTSGNGTVFTDADNAWGDGLQYNGTPGMGANAQTAAVDAHRGLQSTWDFYKNVFGRNGIDNTGKATYSRMHYSTQYDNAFWSDSCFCMTYGDGATGGSVGEADLDTCGHEMTHGVTATTSNLKYSGEPGGLNESTSDILGTMVEFWTLGGGGATIPNAAGSASTNGGKFANYKLFENSWGHAYPNDALRWMHKPSRDGGSADFWSKTVGRLDVHYSSGVGNHLFFLLAHGSQVDSLSENEVSPMMNGITSITGIGNDKAARIWFRALSTYMTSRTNYAGARTATLSAAKDLYGASSVEYATVANAWTAVNVK
ncbi:MAG TPA: M4 family metallopeptidase [Holophagaceae bacterium]|nr:M4 family metallopeptidase [Holophagaceae bacterium]